jgi:predicted small secreted protein
MMKALFALLTLVAAFPLVGCNTIEGAGKDLQKGGEKLQDTAKDVKKSL